MSTDTISKTDMVNITINGKTTAVPKGTTVYNAIQQQGINVPIFCYQNRMPPFGACRVCLVEVEKMPKLQTSCTLEAAEGMVIKTHSEKAMEGRKGILELLLINHPLDCPVCDRGGECPLQENAINYGPGESRFFEEKRHLDKHKHLGPLLVLDRERCIICARCTRFGDLIAGDHALELIDRGYKSEIGTPDDGPAESKFIGNTIMICPVGALTSEVYRFRARPWDNESVESTCTLCPVGCSFILDSRDGEIMRTRSQENPAINDIWLCDKGWFGYEFTNESDRLKTPLIRKNGQLEPGSWDEALALIAEKIKKAIPGGKIAGFGGNPLTVEDNYLFQKLMREGAGTNNVDHRIGMPIFSLTEEGMAPGMEMPLKECEELSFAVFLGLDLTEEFPVIWLRLRQAVNRGAKLLFAGHFSPETDSYFSKTILHAPSKELETIQQLTSEISALAANGNKGALFVGRQYLANHQRAKILSALDKLCRSNPGLMLNIMEGRGNSMGARQAGMHPELGPHGERIDNPGLDAARVLESAASSGWDLLYVAGADPSLKYPSKLWKDARTKLGFLVVQDLFLTHTARQADVVLPTRSYIEKYGTFINIEGRAQKIQPGKEIPAGIYSDSEIFIRLADKLDFNLDVEGEWTQRQVDGNQRSGVQIPERGEGSQELGDRLLATFAHVLFDHGVRMKHNPHLLQVVKEPSIRLNPHEAAKRKIKEGDTIQLSGNGNAITAKIKLDERVADNTVVLPIGFEEIPVHELSPNLLNGIELKLNVNGMQ